MGVWMWIMDELRKAVKALPLSKRFVDVEKDDIMQNVALILLNDSKLAKDIYDNKKVGALYTIVRREIYNNEATFFFENKMDFCRFQRIMAVCEKYGIQPILENAYKISALLETGNNNFTISGVASLLARVPSDLKLSVPDLKLNKLVPTGGDIDVDLYIDPKTETEYTENLKWGATE